MTTIANKAVIALAGNPNTGKSTVFNALTGAHQHVGNWPGKTVEKKEGVFEYKGAGIKVVDLPGTYSLSAYSLEEEVARDFIVDEKPALVVNVVDAANLERNLYLTAQILDTGAPMLLALNMMDAARARKININAQKLSAQLGGIPVVTLTARKKEGLDALKEAIRQALESADRRLPASDLRPSTFGVDYGPLTEKELAALGEAIARIPALTEKYPPRWLAIQLLEGDNRLTAEVLSLNGSGKMVAKTLAAVKNRLQARCNEDLDVALADRRYRFVNNLAQNVVTRPAKQSLTPSDKIDKIVTHRWLGVPLFLALMWAVFKLTTNVAAPYLNWIDSVINGPLARWAAAILGAAGWGGSWLESLLINGVMAGVGGVLVFVPVLMSLYLALAILEDTGYMARAAFVMDRFMRVLGLHGKSFLPLVIGFGCSVPAIYATRTLENHRDRLLTGLLVPFMSCSARLPVYILFAAIFFPRHSGAVVFSLYLLGILIAVALGLLLKRVLFQSDEPAAFVMELPPYRPPNLKSVWIYMWTRTSAFIHNAWTIILAASVLIWFLMAVPTGGNAKFAAVDMNDSAFAAVSGAIAPALSPLGFGTWEAASALSTGFVAKEVVVSTMALVYNAQEPDASPEEPVNFTQDAGEIIVGFGQATLDTLKSIPLVVGVNLFDEESEAEPTALMSAISAGFEQSSGGRGALAAYAFLVFVLLYTPCMVTVAAQKQEFGVKWMWVSIIGQLAIAWLAALVVFQGGKLLGAG